MMKIAGRAAVQWGLWQCGIGEPNKLVSLADLVRFVVTLDVGRLWREAAELVLDELHRQVPTVEIFERQRGDAYAIRIDGDCVLREHDPGEVARIEWKRQTGYVVKSWGAFDGAGAMHPEEVEGRPSRSEAKGPHGALMLAREAWTGNGCALPAALDIGRPALFAIRASVAGELFGFDRAADEARPWPAALRAHDALRWGHNVSHEARPRILCRVADAVGSVQKPGAVAPNGMALNAAAAWLIEQLATVEGLQWFMLDSLRLKRPRLVTEGDEPWRAALPAGVDLLESRGYSYTGQSWDYIGDRGSSLVRVSAHVGLSLTSAELVARNAVHLIDPRCKAESDTTRLDPAVVAEMPAVPELRGVAGLAEWLRLQWVDNITSPAGLDEGCTAYLAVPVDVVAELLQRAAPAPLHLVPAVSVEMPSQVATVGAAAVEWSPAELQTLVDAHAEECRTGRDRGARGRVLRRWALLFPAREACSVTRVQALLDKAKAAGITPTSSASWAAPVLQPRGAGKANAKRGTVHKMAG